MSPKKTKAVSRRKFLVAGTAGAAAVAVAHTGNPAQGILGGLLPTKPKPLLPLLPVIPGITDPGGILSQVGLLTDPTTAALGLTINPPQPPTPEVIDPYALHRLRRWTYGPTPTLLNEVNTKAKADQYLNAQLNPNQVPDPAVDAMLKSVPSDRMTPREVRTHYQNRIGTVLYEQITAKTIRATQSNRQLQERMTEFLMDHFNVMAGDRFLIYRQHMENTVVRPNALGKFADVLVGVARHPAMLLYLDAALSVKGAPNQNYARELQELHTVGASGGFSETDVWEASYLLTGMTVENDEYKYRSDLHDNRKVTILGKTYGPNTTEATIVEFLNDLARHPSTAQRVAARLCTYFVKDIPSDALVTSTAKVYRDNDTALAPTLKHIFASPEFNGARLQKVARPYEMLLKTMRAAAMGVNLETTGAIIGVVGGATAGTTGLVPGTDLTRILAGMIPNFDNSEAGQALGPVSNDPAALLATQLAGASATSRIGGLVMSTGQHPGGWGPPNGYPLVGGAYLNGAGFYRTVNAAMVTAGGYVPQVMPNYPALFGFPQNITAQDLFTRVFRAFVFRDPTAHERTALSGGQATPAVVPVDQVAHMAGRWAQIVAVIPENHLR